MSSVIRGHIFASEVGKYLERSGIYVQPEYSIGVGICSKSMKPHRFDFGSSEVLVECKCYGWTVAGNNPSAKISALNEAMMYFHSTPGRYRKMLFLPKTSRSGSRNQETFAEYYIRLNGHFIPASVEVWELDVTTDQARQVGSSVNDKPMCDTQLITARSLLLCFLELRRMSPDLKDWSEERLKSNPPRLFRLLQLTSMFRAFGLKWDPQSFIEGMFIEPKNPRYASLLKILLNEMLNEKQQGIDGDDLPDFFKILFDYRTRIDKVLSFSSGVMEASGLYLQAHLKSKELNLVIWDNIATVENLLIEIISPEGESFSVEELVKSYGYPIANLSEIDEDWC